MSQGIRVTPWAGTGAPVEADLHERLRREGVAPYAWSNGPGDFYAVHVHPYDKALYIVQGSIAWILPETGQEIETRAGDRIDLPRGTLHAARVGAQGVMCLEGHRA